MRKWTNLKKAFTAITVCVFAALLLSGCDGGASLGNAKSYKFKPVFHFQTCDDNVWCLDVNGVLYKKGVEEREWKLQPEYYVEVIGYIGHSWTIHKVGFAEDDPDKNFLYTDFEYGRLDAQDLYYKDGFDLLPVGPDTVTRIEYHPPDGNRDTWISSE